MGIAGIPWWTTDIGGFHGGVDDDPAFQELVTRWFEFATFCPVMRMHGDREPHTAPLSNVGGGKMPSGGATEPWAYGEEAYQIMKKYLQLRTKLKPYITLLMQAAHEKGTPVIRPFFFDFPSDQQAWTIEDQYMFGPDILVAPVLYSQKEKTTRQVYLPVNSDWINPYTGEKLSGGQTITVKPNLAQLPVFIKETSFDKLTTAFDTIR